MRRAVTTNHDLSGALTPGAMEVHRQTHMGITCTKANALLLEHVSQISEPSPPKAGVTVQHGRLVKMRGERRHKTKRCPRIPEVQKGGRTAGGSRRMKVPRVIILLDLQTKLLEGPSHGTRIVAQPCNAPKGHAGSTECSHLQPANGVAFRRGKRPLHRLDRVQSINPEHLDIVGHMSGFGRRPTSCPARTHKPRLRARLMKACRGQRQP